MKDRYSIGEVSEICQISRKALRYYDEIGLIPSRRDAENNYRFYTADALLAVPVIKYYKQMGFKLDEMKALVRGNVYHTVKERFELKIHELESARTELQRKYESVKAWHDLILEAEQVIDNQICEVGVKFVEPADYLHMEQAFDNRLKESIINLPFTQYVEEVRNQIIGPVMIHFPSREDRILNRPQTIRIMQKTLGDSRETLAFGGHTVLACYHIGPHETIGTTYEKIQTWAEANHYTLAPDAHERYVTDHWTTREDSLFVTEVMIRARRPGTVC